MTATTTSRTVQHSRHPISHRCECATCQEKRNDSDRRGRTRSRERRLARTITQLAASGVRVFYGVRCADCGAGLHDSQGEPRWEILFPLRFVCLHGCRIGGRS